MRLEIIEKAWTLRRKQTSESLQLIEDVLKNPSSKDEYYAAMNVKNIIDLYHCNYDTAEKELLETFDYFKHTSLPLHTSRNANNLGILYMILGDLSKATTYLMNGLEVANTNNITEMSIFLYYNLAEIYKEIHNFDKAIYLLENAISLDQDHIHPLSNVLYSSIGICYHEAKYEKKAIDSTQKSIELSKLKKDKHSLGLCYIVVAQILLESGQLQEAKKYARESLELRLVLKDNFAAAVSYLRLAEIAFAQNDILQSKNYANISLDMVTELNSNSITANIYEVLYKCFKSLNQVDQALKYSELYNQAINYTHNERLEKSIAILSAEQSIERIKKDAEIYRLNNIELKKKSNELLLISNVGKSLVNALNFDDLLLKIYDNISNIIDAPFLSVGILNEEETLDYKWVLYKRQKQEPYKVINKELSLGFKAIMNKESIYVSDFKPHSADVEMLNSSPEFDNISSVLFCPLYNRDKAIGVITLQSEIKDAYTSDEIFLMEGISSYIAIAIDNANKATIITESAKELRITLNHLKETQNQLIQAEKLAGLGQLVSGVAHELNTPIGSSITMITHQLNALDKIRSSFDEGILKKKTLDNFLLQSGLILKEVEKAILHSSQMIQSFKGLALTDISLVRKSLSITELNKYILSNHNEKIMNHKVDYHYNKLDKTIYTYPIIISTIIGHLISNSIHHSFIDTLNPIINIEIVQKKDLIEINYSDNGLSIPLDVQENMFEPFYSTKKIEGLMGIGLHAVHNLVTQVLKGNITYQEGYIIQIKNLK